MAAGERARRAAFSLAFLIGFSSLFLFYKNMFVLRYAEPGPQVAALAVFCASFAGLALAALLAPRLRAGARGASRPRAVCLAAAAAAAGICASAASWPGALPSAVAGAVCLAAFLTSSTCAWARTAARLPARAALALVAGSCALSFAWGFVRNAAWFPSWAACAFPLASAACWLACERLLRRRPDRGGAARAEGPARAADGLPREMPALLVALYLVSSLIRSAAVAESGSVGALPPNAALSLASMALDLAMLLALLRLSPRQVLYLGWLAAAGLVFVGSAALGAGSPPALALGSDAVALGRLFIMSLLFVYAASIGRDGRQDAPASAATDPAAPFLACAALPYAASVALRDLLLAASPGLAEALSAIVVGCSAATAVLTVALTVRALARQSRRIEELQLAAAPSPGAGSPGSPDAPPAPGAPSAPGAPDRTERAVASLAAERGLTEKERQACLLLARGYSLQAVADAMGVSLNTARTHYRGVYSKLAVHTRQELIELVEQAGQV